MRISDWSSDVCSSDLGMDADLPGRCDQPLGNQRLRRAQPVEHVERGRMKGRGPEVVGEPGVGFEDEEGDSLLLQQAGRRQSDRPRARDDDWFDPLCHLVLADVICIRYMMIRSEEHTSELQSLMRISNAVFCLKKKTRTTRT